MLDAGSSNRRGVFIGGVPMNSQFIRLMFVPMVLALVGLVASDSYADKATIELWNGTYTGDVSNGVPHGQGVFIHPIHIYHSTLYCTRVSWVNIEYPENKAVTLWDFGMSKSGLSFF